MARKARGAAPFWPTVLQQLTGYEEGAHPEVGAPGCWVAGWLADWGY